MRKPLGTSTECIMIRHVARLKPCVETFVNKSILRIKLTNSVGNISNNDSLCADKCDARIQRQTWSWA